MDDTEVIRAFVEDGATRAFGPSVHVEGDALLLSGWWHGAFRVRADAFIVRNEEPPEATTALADVAAALSARGLRQVGVDLPLIQPVTYVSLSLGDVSWALWASELASGEQALADRAGAESFFRESAFEEAPVDLIAQQGGARVLAGLPPSLVVVVGLPPSHTEALQAGLPDCQVEARALEEGAEACGALLPSLVVVDAGDQEGCNFIMELRASACGRFTPVVAVVEGAGVPLGADASVDPGQAPEEWVPPLRELLP